MARESTIAKSVVVAKNVHMARKSKIAKNAVVPE
jgi:UDP-3-O-[3-hydroxymyristoyl] glucosamine N-acyltransferase